MNIPMIILTFHLFGNPDWFKQNYKINNEGIIRRLRIFESHMLMSYEKINI